MKKKQGSVMPVEKIFLSTAEVMKYLDCSEDFIEKLRNEAKLNFYRLGRKFLYAKADIDKLILKNRVI